MKIVSFGPDWYTGTNILNDDGQSTSLFALFSDVSEGHKKWRAGGYKGLECLKTGIKYGSRLRKDGQADEIFIASGSSSRDALVHLDGQDRYRATRFDLQITIKFNNRNAMMASDLYDTLRVRRRLGTSPIGNRKMSLIRSEAGDTFYLGSRTSKKRLFRFYDKSYEMRGYPGEYWRAEVQYGRDKAQAALGWYFDAKPSAENIVDLVCSEFFDACEWSPTPQYVYAPSDFPSLPEEQTTLGKKLTWLKTCVRPTVGMLVNEGMEGETLEALGLKAVETWMKTTRPRDD